MYKDRIPARGKARARVAYFVGCATNTLYPDTGKAAVDVLTHNGIEVVVPEGQVCCGMPALADGDLPLVQEMAQKNVAALTACDVDAIVRKREQFEAQAEAMGWRLMCCMSSSLCGKQGNQEYLYHFVKGSKLS